MILCFDTIRNLIINRLHLETKNIKMKKLIFLTIAMVASLGSLFAQDFLSRVEGGFNLGNTTLRQDDITYHQDETPVASAISGEIWGSYLFNYIGHFQINVGRIGNLSSRLSNITKVTTIDLSARKDFGENFYLKVGAGNVSASVHNFQIPADSTTKVSVPTAHLEMGGGWKYIDLFIRGKVLFGDSFDKLIGIADAIVPLWDNELMLTVGIQINLKRAIEREKGHSHGSGGVDF